MSELKGLRLGRYELLEELGSGGMGVVYRALDHNLRREVAIKILDSEGALGEEVEQRFFREARALATMTHPNIVTVHDFRALDGYRFFAMELVEGSSLEDLIEEERLKGEPLPEDHEVLGVALPLADALSAAHDRGVIHRDLKPGNVMVSKDGRVKVLDFGVAKLVDGQLSSTRAGASLTTETGLLLGTVPYMCPELIESGEVDARSDVFALGVVLYELASRKRPFQGATSMVVLSAILRDEPTPIEEVAPGLSPPLARLITKCLAKDPAERFQTASELHFELDTLRRRLDSQELELLEPLPSRLYRRKRLTWAAVVAAIVTCVGLVAWGLVTLNETRVAGKGGASQAQAQRSEAQLAASQRDPLRRPRIAVRAFHDVGEPMDPYFAVGIADEISSRLSSIKSVGVVSRSEGFGARDELLSLQEIRDDLDVDFLLEGTVQWSREGARRIRVIPRLIDLADETQVWSEPFSRELKNIFEVQGQVALAVVSALEIGLLKDEREQLQRVPTEDSQAYLTYLRGRHFWRQRGSGLSRSLEFFEEASSLDPDFALAHLGVADTYSLFAVFGNMSASQALPRALAAAEKAIELDPTLAEAYASSAFIKMLQGRSWQEAEEEFELSLELNPNYAEGRRWWALYLACLSRFDEAVEQAQRAIELDPLSPQAIGNMALVLNTAGRYSQAIEHTERYLEFHRDYPVAYWLLGWAHIRGGSSVQGLESMNRALELSPQPIYKSYKAIGLIAAERPLEAMALVDELIAESRERYVRPYSLAMVFSEMRDRAKTLEWLTRAVEDNDIGLIFLGVERGFDWLREDPAFTQLMERAGFDSGGARSSE